MDAASLQDALRALIDQAAIETLLKRYARALDERAFDALDAVFTPDAQLDYTCAGGIAGAYPEVKAWLAEVLTPIAEMQHFTTNVEVELDGDRAAGKSYTINVNGMRTATGEVKHMVVGAQYIDRLVRTPAGWRIAERREERFTVLGHRFGPEDLAVAS
ncbi:nuclear transport factor 2 family protein [Flavisphingomonas formosensis]|uniref:nuclear transport factor 2 family protein n=1 Tax=Flavisphingomonas formosensis TaxID=861534 RepID=UPI0012FA4BCF|nr:nuclear transport factor 2 family protein [Sphingomonas formosensis]